MTPFLKKQPELKMFASEYVTSSTETYQGTIEIFFFTVFLSFLDKPCSEQIQEGQENKVNDIKKGLESTALANSTNNAIQNDEEEEEEQDNDSSNLNKSSGLESHAAGIARLNVTGENSHVVETNNATAEGSADSSLPQSSTNLTSNAVVPPSEPLCNGHSQQETHTRHPTDGVTKNLASTGKQESGSPEDPASPGFQLEAEQVSTPPAGNGAQANAEQCWENSTRLVNSVSLDLESCDGEVEDMQTDGVSEEGKTFLAKNILFICWSQLFLRAQQLSMDCVF